MEYLLVFCQFALAIVMLIAATGKLLNLEQLLAALRLSAIPELLVQPLAWFTPLVELCLAISLLLSPTHLLPIVMLTTLCLLSIFTLWMINVQARGLHIQCGCFGTGNTHVGPATLLRNGVLLALSLGGFLLARVTHSLLPSPSLWMMLSVLTGAMCLMLLTAFQHTKSALILTIEQMTVARSPVASPVAPTRDATSGARGREIMKQF